MAKKPKSEATAPHQAQRHIVQGDQVRVIRGNHRELEGTVRKVLPRQGKVVLEGINQRKRHQRATRENPEGGIITFEQPVDISNVMLIDPHTGDATRVRSQRRDDGSSERVAVKTGNIIPPPESKISQ